MPSIWKSTHPDVLAWWADLEKRNKTYTKACRKVEKATDRNIVLRTGFGDDAPMGLSRTYREPLPPGWKYGWGKRDSGFMEPRYTPSKDHPKEACEAAQEMIRNLNRLHPDVRSEAEERFGVPDCAFFGLSAISPGYWFHDGVLWVTFGDHDFEPKNREVVMLDYFEPAKRSEYYLAREAAGEKEDE